MTVSRAWLATRLDLELAPGNNRVILSNATSGSITDTTDLAVIIAAEPIQTVGGYAPQTFTYTAGTSTYNAGTSRQETPAVTATFQEAVGGAGFQFTYGVLLQGRGATANKTISAVDTSTDRVTCTAHGMVNGDRGFVTSTGSVPGGLSTQRYYMKNIDANTLEFYTDAALTNKVDITSAGSGTLTLRYANGVFVKAESYTQTTIAAGQSQSLVVTHYASV